MNNKIVDHDGLHLRLNNIENKLKKYVLNVDDERARQKKFYAETVKNVELELSALLEKYHQRSTDHVYRVITQEKDSVHNSWRETDDQVKILVAEFQHLRKQQNETIELIAQVKSERQYQADEVIVSSVSTRIERMEKKLSEATKDVVTHVDHQRYFMLESIKSIRDDMHEAFTNKCTFEESVLEMGSLRSEAGIILREEMERKMQVLESSWRDSYSNVISSTATVDSIQRLTNSLETQDKLIKSLSSEMKSLQIQNKNSLISIETLGTALNVTNEKLRESNYEVELLKKQLNTENGVVKRNEFSSKLINIKEIISDLITARREDNKQTANYSMKMNQINKAFNILKQQIHEIHGRLAAGSTSNAENLNVIDKSKMVLQLHNVSEDDGQSDSNIGATGAVSCSDNLIAAAKLENYTKQRGHTNLFQLDKRVQKNQVETRNILLEIENTVTL